jgi:hypothetical protein
VLQATPSGYIVQLEDGTQVNMPEHVAVKAGLVQPTAGSQLTPPPVWQPPTPAAGTEMPFSLGASNRAQGVSEGLYNPNPAPDPNTPVHRDATEDIARAGRKKQHISQLRQLLGLE